MVEVDALVVLSSRSLNMVHMLDWLTGSYLGDLISGKGSGRCIHDDLDVLRGSL